MGTVEALTPPSSPGCWQYFALPQQRGRIEGRELFLDSSTGTRQTTLPLECPASGIAAPHHPLVQVSSPGSSKLKISPGVGSLLRHKC